MKITSEDQITYEDAHQDKKIWWQYIMFNGQIIGALAQIETTFLNPIEEHYQKCVPESEKEHFDGWYIAEDEGYIFGYFYTLEKFIEYHNSKV